MIHHFFRILKSRKEKVSLKRKKPTKSTIITTFIDAPKKNNTSKKASLVPLPIWETHPEVVCFCRYQKNPIVSPRPQYQWEAWQTFNPGVVMVNGGIHMVYRAVSYDGLSRIGYARSDDGVTISQRLAYPVYEHHTVSSGFQIYSLESGGSWGGAEDPRLVRVGSENRIYMTYTACDGGLRVGLTSISVDDFLTHKWNWRPAVLISPPGKINKNWMIFPEKINGKYAILHALTPKVLIDYFDSLEFDGQTYIDNSSDPKLAPPQIGSWDKWIRGPGAPPLKTKDGWLLFYHAMDDDRSKYKVGAMLLDLNDPTKIITKTKQPILEPNTEYENNGFKSGVVYLTGAVIKDNQILVYYGCADSYIGVASANLDDFLKALKSDQKPIFKILRKLLKK